MITKNNFVPKVFVLIDKSLQSSFNGKLFDFLLIIFEFLVGFLIFVIFGQIEIYIFKDICKMQ